MKKFLLHIAFLFLLVTGGCKKMIEIDPSTTQLLENEVYKDSVTIQSAIAGLYATIAFDNFSAYNGQLSLLGAFSADELGYVGNNFDPFINNALLSDNNSVANIWSQSYSVIYVANSIIKGMENAENISEKFRTQVIAEARLIRAFSHFYLVNLFGDVPLITGTDVQVNAVSARVAATRVYDAIKEDLLYAQAVLPVDYVHAGNQRTRVNKWVATAFLSRVYLYLGDWANAEAQATAVIENPLYTLPTDLSKVFSTSSTEAIWQFYNDGSGYTQFANAVLPNAVTKIPTYVLTPGLVNVFEPGDKRKEQWTANLDYNGTSYTYLTKYKSIKTGENTEYYTLFRLAELYLIRAEARARQNNPDGAKLDLQAVRTRAGLDMPAITGETGLLAAIEKERRTELFAEWAHRWLDLKRTGRADAVLGALKPAWWKPAAALYPIPAAQRAANTNLTQNPGYN